MDGFSVDGYLGNPHMKSFFPEHAKKAGLVIGLRSRAVLAVNRMANVSKILDRVVGGVAIDMVNVIGRPNTVHIKPCQLVCGIPLAVNAQADTFFLSRTASLPVSSNLSNLGSSGQRNAPRKHASLRIVVQQFLKTTLGKGRMLPAHLPFLLSGNLGSDAPRLQPRGVALS